MPIVCEAVKNVKKGAVYGSDKEFVTAYPSSNPIPALGTSWQFAPCFLPKKYALYKDEIGTNFTVRSDDVFSVTFPKSGSHWTQEMIWLLNNDLDYTTAEKMHIDDRFMHIELDICFKKASFGMLERINALPSPRHLKSHLPAGLLPNQIWTVKPKIIYVSRGIKDNAVSYYHHYKNFHIYDSSKEEFMEAFVDGQIIFSPQHNHIKDFWFMRNEENVLFLTFEEMKRDLSGVLRKTSKFLGKRYADDQLFELERFLSFESMKSRDNTRINAQFLKQYADVEGAGSQIVDNNNTE